MAALSAYGKEHFLNQARTDGVGSVAIREIRMGVLKKLSECRCVIEAEVSVKHRRPFVGFHW